MNNQTILHLGSGKCSELDSYLASDANRIVLVEANTSICGVLKKRCNNNERVELIAKAVSEQANAELNLFNYSKGSSLRKPTGLRRLFPGLQLKGQVPVETVKASELVDQLNLQAGEDNLLVVDLPGEEYDTLKNLADHNQLLLFPEIKLYCGLDSLYENSKPASEIIRFLTDLGYETVEQSSDFDPDRPCFVLRLDPVKLENRELEKAVNQAKSELSRLRKEYAEKVASITQSRDEQAKLTEEYASEIDRLTNERDEQCRSNEEKQKQIDVLNEEYSRLKTQYSKLENEKIASITQLRDEQTKLAEEYANEINRLTNERNNQSRSNEQKQQQIDVLNEEYGRLKTQYSKLENEAIGLVEENKRQSLEQAQLAEECEQHKRLASERLRQIEELKSRTEEQESMNRQMNAEIQRLTENKNRLDTLILEKQNELETLNADCESLKIKIESQAKDKDALAKQNEQLAVEQSRLLEANKQQNQLSIEHAKQIDALTKANAEQATLAADWKNQLDVSLEKQKMLEEYQNTLQKDLQTANEREVGLANELKEARRTIDLSMKFQMLKEEELKDLRQRYQAALTAQESQHKLLAQLSERLTLASEYFHKISDENVAKEREKYVDKREHDREKTLTEPNKKQVARRRKRTPSK